MRTDIRPMEKGQGWLDRGSLEIWKVWKRRGWRIGTVGDTRKK